jgi:hypothetical protein
MKEPDKKRNATPDRSRRTAGPVRITLPARIAYSPDALKESIANTMERIGCPKCFSGADCYFQMERQFALRTNWEPDPTPWQEATPALEVQPAHVFTVGLAKAVRYDINNVFRAVDKVIDIIGAHPCISGFDVFFKDYLQHVVIPENLEQAQVFDQRF